MERRLRWIMRWMLRWMRRGALVSAVVTALLSPNAADAQSGRSFLAYGSRGLFDGALVGLATGHLATGPHYESGEWKTLVYGLGIGGVVGVGVGVGLAFADRASDRSTGFYVLRDLWYGAMLGGLTGTAAGALVYIDTERPRDILTGTAIGGLIGAGIGIAFGILEGLDEPSRQPARPPPDRRTSYSITLVPAAHGPPMLMPTLRGQF